MNRQERDDLRHKANVLESVRVDGLQLIALLDAADERDRLAAEVAGLRKIEKAARAVRDAGAALDGHIDGCIAECATQCLMRVRLDRAETNARAALYDAFTALSRARAAAKE